MIDIKPLIVIYLGGILLVIARRLHNPHEPGAGGGTAAWTVFTSLVYILFTLLAQAGVK